MTSPLIENVLAVFNLSDCKADVAVEANPVKVGAVILFVDDTGMEKVTKEPLSVIDESLTDEEVINLAILFTVPAPVPDKD
jgi:hypothetical protein